eukprot:4996253-Pleurochrysis_carterae.AAC.1
MLSCCHDSRRSPSRSRSAPPRCGRRPRAPPLAVRPHSYAFSRSLPCLARRTAERRYATALVSSALTHLVCVRRLRVESR